MEYVSCDEFKKQPFKVRKALIKYHEKYHKVRCDSTPVYSETELRKCIEDTTGYRIGISYLWDSKSIVIDLVKQYYGDTSEIKKRYTIKTIDLVEAYWKTIIEILK